MSRPLPIIAGALVLAAAVAPLAVAADSTNDSVARRACMHMGLNPSEAPFTACVASLLQSMTGGVAQAPAGQSRTAENNTPISGR